MPVTYDSYEAKVLERAIAMLAASATFQALVGAANATAALAYIVESDGGAPDDDSTLVVGTAVPVSGAAFTFASTPAWAEVHSTAKDTELAGVGVYDHSGQVTIVLHQARRVGAETPPEAMRRARNKMGLIRDEIEARFGASDALATGTVDTSGPYLPDSTGADGDGILSTITIDWFA